MPLESGDIDLLSLLDIVVGRIRHDVSLRFASFYHKVNSRHGIEAFVSLQPLPYNLHSPSAVFGPKYYPLTACRSKGRCFGDIISRLE